MIVLVCGGRDYVDVDKVNSTLDAIKHDITAIIHGGAKGADTCAELWAKSRFVRSHAFIANWKEFKNSAGVLRNKRMLVEGKPDLVIAFPGGKGTADMIRQATKAGIKVRRIK